MYEITRCIDAASQSLLLRLCAFYRSIFLRRSLLEIAEILRCAHAQVSRANRSFRPIAELRIPRKRDSCVASGSIELIPSYRTGSSVILSRMLPRVVAATLPLPRLTRARLTTFRPNEFSFLFLSFFLSLSPFGRFWKKSAARREFRKRFVDTFVNFVRFGESVRRAFSGLKIPRFGE